MRIKSNSVALCIFLLITTTFFISLPLAKSDTATYLFISVAPHTVGKGQQVEIAFFLSSIPPTSGNVWHGFTIAVQKPDGKNETLGPYPSDTVAAGYTKYIPDQIGNYTFQAFFAGENLTNSYYKPSMSLTAQLTVQEEPIPSYPNNPLPTDYWTRPINAENRDWWSITDNWLQSGYNYDFRGGGFFGDGGAFANYTSAPNSSHILWTKEIAFGGLVGGPFGSIDYYNGLSYEGKWIPPVIINGRLFYSTPLGSSSFAGTMCVDLTTGEEIWWKNITISRGQLYAYDSPNQHGVIPYLWSTTGTTWQMYDPFRGDLICEFANASTGLFAQSAAGDLLCYILSGTQNRLTLWNSSYNTQLLAGTTGTNYWQWRPRAGQTYNWSRGIQWNVTVPDVPGTQAITSMRGYSNGILLAAAGTMDIGYDATTGAMLWNETRPALPENQSLSSPGGNIPSPIGEGVYCRFIKETMQWNAYSLLTGKQIWGPSEPYTNGWAVYPAAGVIAYGHLYVAGYDGLVHCHDLATGKILWEYASGDGGFETPYGQYPFFGGMTIADGKIYIATNEHSPNSPPIRGERLHCIDAETGQGIWKVLGLWNGPGGGRGSGMGPCVVADGILVSLNGDDNRLYGFGKGPSSTTVTAPQSGISLGSSFTITGTVKDESAGTKNPSQVAIFPNGAPAVSDDSQEGFMEYLYEQQAYPTNAKGVPVSIDAVDPNGNLVHLGDVISDAKSGQYSLGVNADTLAAGTGTYQVISTFAGSNSYGSSNAVSAFTVYSTPTTTPTATAQPITATTTDLMTYIAVSTIAIIIAIALVGLMLFKKRP